jgi:hypothetical protein
MPSTGYRVRKYIRRPWLGVAVAGVAVVARRAAMLALLGFEWVGDLFAPIGVGETTAQLPDC